MPVSHRDAPQVRNDRGTLYSNFFSVNKSAIRDAILEHLRATLELQAGASPGVIAANEPAVRTADISMVSPAPVAPSSAPAADFDMNSISLDLQPPEGAGDKPPPKAS